MSDDAADDPDRREPGALAWAVAAFGLFLRVAAAVCGALGLAWVLRGEQTGLWAMAAAAVLVAADVAIDYLWLNARVAASSEPHLNQRTAQLIGRQGIVAEEFVAGRGKVRIGDTVWLAEGPDAATGAAVRVTGVNGMSLVVGPPGPG